LQPERYANFNGIFIWLDLKFEYGRLYGEEGFDTRRKYERSYWVNSSRKPRTNHEEEETDMGERQKEEREFFFFKKKGT
jgi:hypothetical protein